jgi:hypothetical protein
MDVGDDRELESSTVDADSLFNLPKDIGEEEEK